MYLYKLGDMTCTYIYYVIRHVLIYILGDMTCTYIYYVIRHVLIY